jgi:hypothetical protein
MVHLPTMTLWRSADYLLRLPPILRPRYIKLLLQG